MQEEESSKPVSPWGVKNRFAQRPTSLDLLGVTVLSTEGDAHTLDLSKLASVSTSDIEKADIFNAHQVAALKAIASLTVSPEDDPDGALAQKIELAKSVLDTDIEVEEEGSLSRALSGDKDDRLLGESLDESQMFLARFQLLQELEAIRGVSPEPELERLDLETLQTRIDHARDERETLFTALLEDGLVSSSSKEASEVEMLSVSDKDSIAVLQKKREIVENLKSDLTTQLKDKGCRVKEGRTLKQLQSQMSDYTAGRDAQAKSEYVRRTPSPKFNQTSTDNTSTIEATRLRDQLMEEGVALSREQFFSTDVDYLKRLLQENREKKQLAGSEAKREVAAKKRGVGTFSKSNTMGALSVPPRPASPAPMTKDQFEAFISNRKNDTLPDNNPLVLSAVGYAKRNNTDVKCSLFLRERNVVSPNHFARQAGIEVSGRPTITRASSSPNVSPIREKRRHDPVFHDDSQVPLKPSGAWGKAESGDSFDTALSRQDD